MQKYSHCIDCGVKKAVTISKRCRACSSARLRTRDLYPKCIGCGIKKIGQERYYPRCKSCAARIRPRQRPAYPIAYTRCVFCGKVQDTEAKQRTPLCASCAAKKRWMTKGR